MTTRISILNDLKLFKCLNDVIEEVEEVFDKCGFLGKITTLLSKSKDFIYYGGASSNTYKNALNDDIDNPIIKIKNSNPDNNYWKICKKEGEERPEYRTRCLCFHEIKKNCYIKSLKLNKIFIVGKCCIKKFIHEDMRGRRCEICMEKHRNSKNNICNVCRKEEKIARNILEEERRNILEEERRGEEIARNILKEKRRKEEIARNILEEKRRNKNNNFCNFGKYKGLHFNEVIKDKNYIYWCKETFLKDKKKYTNMYFLIKYSIENQ